MPIINIQLLEGRTVEQKKWIIQEVTDAVVRSASVPIENVRVIITDIPLENWGTAGETKAESTKVETDFKN